MLVPIKQLITAVFTVTLITACGSGSEPQPEAPHIPIVPIEPAEPIKPEIPIVPIEPAEPIEPEIPIVPIEPAEPIKPEIPIVPIEPAEPIEPEIPIVPIEPAEPIEPEIPTIPIEPAEPIEPIEPETQWDTALWKITLPVSRDTWYGSGGTSAAEISPTGCGQEWVFDDELDIEYFTIDKLADPQQMHFIVDMGDPGATTTNSNYVRSELRELYNWQRPCASSSTQNWAISGEHQLESTLKINDFPHSQMPKVIVGQVHGYNIKQALVKIQWEGNDKPVRAILNYDFLPDNQSGGNYSFSIEFDKVPAYENWDYKIDVTPKALTITVNGNTKVMQWGVPFKDKDGNTVTLSKDWLNETYYFKAGIYPQIQPSTSLKGELFDVSFSHIKLTHKI